MPPLESFEVKTIDEDGPKTYNEVMDEVTEIYERVIKAGATAVECCIDGFAPGGRQWKKMSVLITAEMPEPPRDHFGNPLSVEVSAE